MVANLDVLARDRDMRATIEQHNIAEVIAEVAKNYREHAALYEISIVQTPESHATRARVDRRMLALAFENLLANALHHCPRKSTVEVSLEDGEGTFSVHVDDAGRILDAHASVGAASLEAQSRSGRQAGTRYSSGLALFAAGAAARMAGVELEFGVHDGKNRMSLRIPTTIE
jgi:K+-sensing histidine kinase KdpD